MTFVMITRCEDPLEGERVQVLRRRQRKHGRVDLLVVLPNGRKRLVPQAWTDAEPAGDVAADEDDLAATLGTVQHLRRRQNQPGVVKSLFGTPEVRYAAD